MPHTEMWLVAVLVIGWSQASHGSHNEYEPVTYHPTTYKTYKDTHGQQESSPKYGFQYAVRDDHYGPNYGAAETRDGYDTKGSYFVDLPDGRRQTVNYYVSKDSGYVADVTYEYTGKVHEYTPKKNLAKGYRKPEPIYEDISQHVYHHLAEPGYQISDVSTNFQSDPIYKASRTVYPTSQPRYLNSDQIYQLSEPGYRISEQSYQTSEPGYLTSSPAFQRSEQNYRTSDPNYRVSFASPNFSPQPLAAIGTALGSNIRQNTETFHGSASKFDGLHNEQQKPLQIRRTYQEIPAPKPVVVSPEHFSNAQGGGRENQRASSNQNDLLPGSSKQGNRGETQGSLHQASQQGNRGESQGSVKQFTHQRSRSESQGSLNQFIPPGIFSESQGSTHQSTQKRIHGESQGSLQHAPQQGNEGESQGSLHQSTLQGIRGESQGSLHQSTLQKVRDEFQGSFQHASQQGNQGASQGSLHQASPHGNYVISPGNPNQLAHLGNLNYQNLNFYSNGGSSNKPTAEYSFLKPPLVKTFREIEQYNIDAAEYI